MSILKSKILSFLILITIIVGSSLPALFEIGKDTGDTLAVGYVIVIMTAISSIVSITLTYLLNLIILRFFAHVPMKNNVVIFNFISLSIAVNIIVVCVLTLGLNVNVPWLVLGNPFYFICQYYFYGYLTKAENVNNKRAIHYLATSFAFTIIGHLITN
jgi:hypothetical protein